MVATGGVYVAQPLDDTALCENLFQRVGEIPDEELSFEATFDGEPVEVQSTPEDEGLPPFGVFRFGRLHVEAVSFTFAFPGYDGSLLVSAVDCGIGGSLYRREADEVAAFFTIQSATFRTHTASIDGFVGRTHGAIHSEWSERTDTGEPGEQHVFEATFVLDAAMADQRANQF